MKRHEHLQDLSREHHLALKLALLARRALAAWLLRYDIARRNARQSGLTRYIALCLLSGYLWLALAGDFATQRSGAAANAGALLLFIATLATSVVRGRRQTAKEAPDAAS